MNLISIKNLSKVYTDKILFNNIDFSVDEGEKIGLIGINGAGKSTLLKIIAGIEEADAGEYTKRSNVLINYLSQNPEFEKNKTIYEHISSFNQMYGVGGIYDEGTRKGEAEDGFEKEAKSILNILGFSELRDRKSVV